MQLIRGNHESRAVTQVCAPWNDKPKRIGLMFHYLKLDVWVLHGMRTEIRICQRLDVLHRHVRLLDAVSRDRRSDILRAWWYGTIPLGLICLLLAEPHSAGLSPSIHSIDQIKVVDRFRGMTILSVNCAIAYAKSVLFFRNTSRRSYG